MRFQSGKTASANRRQHPATRNNDTLSINSTGLIITKSSTVSSLPSEGNTMAKNTLGA